MTIPSRLTRRAILSLLVAGSAAVLSACYSSNGGGGQQTILLLVNNRGFYDVNVFAVRATLVSGRRLGTVSGNSQATLRVPVNELQPGGGLVVNVRTVGGRFQWISPSVQVGSGIVARLDVIQTSNGELTQSVMYSQVAPQPDR